MTDLFSIASIGLTFFAVTASPGPATFSNANIAMSRGREVALKYALGLSLGLAFWGLIAATGMGALLQSSIYLLMGIKIAGGLYLLWLAFMSGRAVFRSSLHQVSEPKGGRWFLRGLLLNMSNPKAVLAWMAALSVGMSSESNIYALVAAVSLCIVIELIVYVSYSLLFSIGGVMRAYQLCRRWIDGSVAGLFALAGFGLIRSAFVRST